MAGGSETFGGATRRPSAWQRRAAAFARALILVFAWFAWALPPLERTAQASETEAPAAAAAQVESGSPEHTRPGDAPFVPHVHRSVPAPPEGYNTHDGGWVRFAYHPSVIDKVQPLIQEADAFKAELEQRLGQPILKSVDVRVARTPREMRSLAVPGTEVPSYASGLAYSDLGLVLLTIQPLHPNSEHNLSEIFRHELVHVALHDAVEGRPIPRWFNEGFAVQLSGENRATRIWTLWSATLSENLIPLTHLEATFPADPNEASVAYAEAADFVRYVTRNQEEHRFRAAVARVKTGQPFLAALGDAYGSEIGSLEYEWLEDVARRYTFWPVLFSSTVIWMGVLGLLVWGWRRRKAQSAQTLARWAREEAREDAQREREVVDEAPPRVHIVLTRPNEPEVPEIGPARGGQADVPKVEHDGRWHTLH